MERDEQLQERYGYRHPSAPAPTQGHPNEAVPQPSAKEEAGFLRDMGQGALFGATEAARGLYGFADLLTFDALPDWDEPVVEAPEGFLAGIFGGAVQFGLPYAGLTGLISKFAAGGSAALAAARATGTTAKLTKGQKALQWLNGVDQSKLAKEVLAARNKGDSTGALIKTAIGVSVRGGVGRATVKGIAVDMAAFEGNTARLSDIIQANPALANPVTEWLSGDPDDSEGMGRLKNALEGMGMGVLFDAILDTGRGLNAYRKAKAAGATAEEAGEQVIKALDDSVVSRKQAADTAEDLEFRSREDDVVTVRDADGNEISKTEKEIEADVQARFKEDEELVDEMLSGVDPVSPREAMGVIDDLLNMSAVDPAVNPRKQTKKVNKSQGLTKGDENLAPFGRNNKNPFESTIAYGERLNRAISRNIESAPRPSVKNSKAMTDALKWVRGLAGMDKESFEEALREAAENPDKIAKAAKKALMYRVSAERMARQIGPGLEALARDPNMSAKSLSEARNAIAVVFEFQKGARNSFSELGRGLQQANIDIDQVKLDKRFDKEFTFKPLEALQDIDESNFDPKKAKELLDQMISVMGSDDPMENMRALQEFMDLPMHKQFFQMAQEYHINALLSGISTQVVNAGAAAFMSVWRPMEKIIGASLDYAVDSAKGNAEKAIDAKQVISLEVRNLINLKTEFVETFRAVKQSRGDVFSSKSMFEGERISPIKEFGRQRNMGLFGPLSEAINLPGKTLEKMDQFMKTWNGRARARSLFQEDLMRKGHPPEEIVELTEQRMKTLLMQKGDLRSNAAAARALRDHAEEMAKNGTEVDLSVVPEDTQRLMDLDSAEVDLMVQAQEEGILAGQEATFTNALRSTGARGGAKGSYNDEGKFGKYAAGLQLTIQRNPELKFLMPFVRTPVNIADYGWDHSVGAMLGTIVEGGRMFGRMFGMDLPRSTESGLRLQRMLASPEPAVRAQARTRIAMGIGTMSSIYSLAALEPDEDGLPQITGSGPTDPDVRKAMKAAGWEPFSIKVNGKYISYSRLDPIASVLGITVDMAEYLQENADGEGAGRGFQTLSLATVASVAQNLTSKTYAQGLTNVLDLVTDPDKNGERILGAVGGSFVPTIVANTERILDPDLQEIRTATDRVRSRIPGYSQGMAPRRDLLGKVMKHDSPVWEALVPIRVTKVKDAVVEREMARFAYGFSEPTTTRAGVDLLSDDFKVGNQDAYDRFYELSGEVRIRGLDLRQALRKTIKSAKYQKLDPDDTAEGDRSPRISELNKVLRRYRKAAWEKTLQERPSLRSAVKNKARERKLRKEGRPSNLTL